MSQAEATRKFVSYLEQAIVRSGTSQRAIAEAMETNDAMLRRWMSGTIPTARSAARLADVLADARVAELAALARRRPCDNCRREYDRGSSVGRFCSEECGALWRIKNGDKKHASVPALGKRLALYREGVAAFCRGCEPEGVCRTADCALRAVSPLPLMEGVVAAPRGRKTRWDRPGERERMAEHMKSVWAERKAEARAA